MKNIIYIFVIGFAFLFNNVVFATVLSKSDKANYQQIFVLQKKGQYKKADALIKKLSSKVLQGYILYDRYFSSAYKTSAKEIDAFLVKYSELPIASDVYELGKKKKFKLKSQRPKDVVYGGKSKACSYVRRDEPIYGVMNKTFPYLTGDKKKSAQKNVYRLYRFLTEGKLEEAYDLVDSREVANTFSQEDLDGAKVAVAFSFFLSGEDKKALSLAKEALGNSADKLPLAYWTAGLASWRLKDYKDSAMYFSYAATHKENYPILKGSSAFWAARAYLKLGLYEQVGAYLELASQQPRTFYGMMALRMMGDTFKNVLDKPQTDTEGVSRHFSHPALTRYYALKEVGQKQWADKELARLYLTLDEKDKRRLTAEGAKNGFADELKQLVGSATNADERFPLPNWKPQNNWQVDKALVYSFVRQESCFNRMAKSSVGARGLMQLMPGTAQIMARKSGVKWNPNQMDNEAYNLMLGQSYILYLLETPAISNNLIYLATSYNAGPGNLIKWKNQMNYQNDPLLFIESIPSRETRSFVERIMVNYWVYRILLDKDLSSLDAVISGHWPKYKR